MTPDAKKNVAAAFAANPKEDKFFANEAGHCFKAQDTEDLKEVNRSEFKADIAALTDAASAAEAKATEEVKTKKK